MSHLPERDAAAFLGGSMSTRRARRFEAHLVVCDDCWSEVRAGLAGRALAESAREVASHDLRESVRARLQTMESPRRRRPHIPLVPAAVVVLLVAVSTSLLLRPQAQPAAIAAAVDDFVADKMVSGAPPAHAAPDLTAAGFALAYTGSGSLAGQPVDGYLYKDDAGHKVLLYTSQRSFPVARGAALLPDGASWRVTIDGIDMMCTAEPHALLALSDDAGALDDVAAAMGIGA